MYKCSCMIFEHFGLLCRHILCILRSRFIDKIPFKYLLRRWQKNIIHAEELKRTYSIGDSSSGCEKIVQDIYSILGDCVSLTSHDPQSIEDLLLEMKNIRNKILANPPNKDSRSKSEHFDSLFGVSKPSVNEILNPENIKTKGQREGTKSQRMKGKREIAMNLLEKEPRECHFCKKKILPKEKHDTRNCPLRIQLEQEALEKKKEKEALEKNKEKEV